MDRSRSFTNPISSLRSRWQRSPRLQKIASAAVIASLLLAQAASVSLPAVEAQSHHPPVLELNYLPDGWFDDVQGDCEYLVGWACDRSNYAIPIDVHIYDGGAPRDPGSKLVAAGRADRDGGPGVALNCGGHAAHRFKIPVPESLKDGQVHHLRGYAIDIGLGRNMPLRNLNRGNVTLRCNKGGGGGGGAPKLDVTKSIDANVTAGGRAVYHFTVKNTGDGRADSVVAKDFFIDNNTGERINPPFNFVASHGADCSYAPGQKLFNCSLGAIAPGATKTFSMTFDVPENRFCGGGANARVMNQVDAIVEGRGQSASDWHKVPTTVKCDAQPNLDVEKTVSANVTAGGQAVYHFTVKNNGNGVARNVIAYDFFIDNNTGQRINPAFNFASSNGANCSYDSAKRFFECPLGNIQPGATKNFSMTFDIPENRFCGNGGGNQSVMNQVDVHADGAGKAANDWDKVPTTVKCEADHDPFGHFDGATPDNDRLGGWACDPDNFNRAIDVHIYKGKAGTPGAQLIASGTADRDFASQGVAERCGGVSAHRFIFDAPQSIKNGQTHQLFAYAINIGPGGNQLLNGSPFAYRFTGAPDLDVEKTVSANVNAGGQAVYHFTVKNNGNAVANDVVAYDFFIDNNTGQRIDPAFNFAFSNGATCTYDSTKRYYACPLGNIQPGATKTFSMTFNVPENRFCGNGGGNQSVMNQVDVHAAGAGNAAKDWDKVPTTVQCGSSSSSSSSSSQGNHNPKGHFDGATNNGNTLYGWACDPDNYNQAVDVHIYNGNQFLVGGTANFTGEAAIAAQCGGTTAHRFYIDVPQSIKNGQTHQLYAYAINIGPGQNILLGGSPYHYSFTGGSSSSSSSSSSDGGNPILTVDKSTNQGTVRHGEAIFYTLTVRNVGNGTANGVQVYDNVPFGLDYQPNGSSNGCNLQTTNGVQQVRCQSFNLAPGATETFTLKFMVSQSLACGQTIRNQADVEANNAALQWDDVFSTVICDGGSSSSSSSSSNTSSSSSSFSSSSNTSSSSSSSSIDFCNGTTDLIIQKTGQATVTQGGQIVYTITVTNVSNCDAHQVVVNDVIPGNTFFLTSGGASCTQNTGSNVACTLGTIHAGQQRTFTATFQTYNNVACNTTIYNSAHVSTTTNESNTGNNQSQTVNTSVSCGGNSSSSSSSTNTSGNFYVDITDGENEVEQGDEVEYVLTVRNNEGFSVNNVTATVNLDSDVDYDSCSDNCSRNGRTITWSNVTLHPGETRTFRVDAEVEDDADDELETTAYVGNFSDTDETDVEESDDDVNADDDDDNVDIDLIIETSAGEVLPGGIIYYTVRVRNTGNVNIRDTVNIVANLPAGVTVIDGMDGTYTGNEIRWEINGVDAGDNWTKTFRVSVNSNQTPGTVLYTNVRAFGGGVDESKSVTVNVIGGLPQTGFMTGCASGQCLKLSSINGGAGTPSAPIAVMLSLMGMGAGAGIGLGRRFFFV